MWVELSLPEEVAAALPPVEETERGPSDFSVALEVIGAVSNVVTVGQVVRAAPEIARRIRGWLQSRTGRAGTSTGKETPRLVIKGPGVHVEIDLPPNVPSQRIAAALIEALAPDQAVESQNGKDEED